MSKKTTEALLRVFKEKHTSEQKQEIGTGMFIPNLSGDLSRGKVISTPTADLNPVNKKYVDDSIAGVIEGHVIKDEAGADLTARRNLNFTGAGVTATDNAGTNSTDVTIAGGGDVTAANNLTDVNLIQGDGGVKGIKTTTITTTDAASAVSLKHTQGTDQGLDTGGANAVTAAQVKNAVTASHGVNDANTSCATAAQGVQATKRTVGIPVTNPTAADDFLVFRMKDAATITNIQGCCMDGTSVAFKLNECDANGDNATQICDTCTATTSNTSATITNSPIDAGDYISYTSSANNGAVTKLLITMDYTIP